MKQSMTLQLIGTGSMYPHPERSCSANLLTVGEIRILIDAGHGTWRRLAEYGHSTRDIDYIFLTHFHPDHVSDLVPIIFDRYLQGKSPLSSEMVVAGPAGLNRFLELQYQAYGDWLADARAKVKIVEL